MVLRIATIALLFFSGSSVTADEEQPYRRPPGEVVNPRGDTAIARRVLEAHFWEDAKDAAWQRFSLLEASLIAAGCHDALQRRQWLDAFDAHARPILDRIAENPDVANRRRIALELLHDRVLTGRYRQQSSDIREALKEGDFNCLTATVLYLQLCRNAGLAPVAGCSPTHVVALFAGEPGLQVQTTSRWGFDAVAGATANDQEIRRISDVELVGKVFYNQGVLRLEQAQYAEAVQAFVWSLRLDPRDESASHNLLAALNNGALAAAADHRFEEAQRCLRLAAELDRSHEALVVNEQHVNYQWIEALCRDRQFEKALDVAHRGQERRPDAELYQRAVAVVYQRWAAELLSTQRRSQGQQLLQVAAAELPPDVAAEVERYAMQHSAGQAAEVLARVDAE